MKKIERSMLSTAKKKADSRQSMTERIHAARLLRFLIMHSRAPDTAPIPEAASTAVSREGDAGVPDKTRSSISHHEKWNGKNSRMI